MRLAAGPSSRPRRPHWPAWGTAVIIRTNPHLRARCVWGSYRAGSSGELIRVACVRCPLLAAHCVGHGGFSGWEGGQPALLAPGCPTLRHRTTASPIRLPRPAQHGNVSADRRPPARGFVTLGYCRVLSGTVGVLSGPVGYSRVRTLGYSRVLSGPLGYSRVLSGTLGHCRVLAGTRGATHSGTLGYCEGRVLPEIGAVGSR